MTDSPARNCGECTFWIRLYEKIGVCRRHAPSLGLALGGGRALAGDP